MGQRPAAQPLGHFPGFSTLRGQSVKGRDGMDCVLTEIDCLGEQVLDIEVSESGDPPSSSEVSLSVHSEPTLLAIILLLLKIWKSRSCAGISGKSQVLFAVVFTARYLDLFTNYISLYNTCMKVVYIACSFTTVWMIYSKFKATYDGNHDTFRVEFLVVPTAILAFLVNHDFTPLEILWTFSIYLESVAILPQLFMVSKTGEAETITSHYLFALGVYRTLYLFNWIWRYHFEGFFDLIAIVAGLVQTVLYCDFFYLYITKVLKGKKLSLPA